MLNAYCLRNLGDRWTPVENLDAISDLVENDAALVWAHADVSSLTEHDVATIAEELGLNALAVEDAVNPRQRPKLEAYEEHLFAVMHQLDEIDGQLEATQLANFIGPRWVLTLHAGADRMIAEAMKRLELTPREEGRGTSLIMHAILDAVVDDYEAIANRLETEVEQVEELVLAQPRARLQGRLYSIKQRISRLRRYTLPGERVLAQFLGTTKGTPAERTATHFRDVHDHTLRIIDEIRNIDDLANAMIDLQRSEQANALNEVTKKLTGWAAVIAVPTFIASLYGMNFALIPEEGSLTGFFVALGLMALSSSSLYVYLRKRDWL